MAINVAVLFLATNIPWLSKALQRSLFGVGQVAVQWTSLLSSSLELTHE
jgi:hypothetical protein